MNNKPNKLYTVYNTKTNKFVIVDGTAAECAVAMGLKNLKTFYLTVAAFNRGMVRKWSIETRRRKDNGDH